MSGLSFDALFFDRPCRRLATTHRQLTCCTCLNPSAIYIYNHAFSTSARHADCLRRDCSWTCCSLFCICFSLSFTVFTVCFFEWFIFPYTFNGSSVYLSLPKKKIRLFIRRSTSIVVNGKNVSSKKTIRDFDFGNKQKSSFFFSGTVYRGAR